MRYGRYLNSVSIIYEPWRNCGSYPVEISGGLDTAALVAAGKMQADGSDLVVRVEGKEVSRWLAGMNTPSTKVWINLHLSSKAPLFNLTESSNQSWCWDKFPGEKE